MSAVRSDVFVMSRFVTIYGKCGLGAPKNGKYSFSVFSEFGCFVMSAVQSGVFVM